MILLNPVTPAPNTMYYTFDNSGEIIEVWFDRIDRKWVAPLDCAKRPTPDNPVCKKISREEFKSMFK